MPASVSFLARPPAKRPRSARPLVTHPLWAIGFQVALLTLCLAGLAANLSSAKDNAAALNQFSYYTTQSNTLVAVALALSASNRWRGRPDARWLVIFQSGAMLWVMVTGLAFHFLLASLWRPVGAQVFANYALHYIIPVGMVVNWVVFEDKGRYTWRYVVYWLVYPLGYALFAWVRGGLTGFYPYWFLNSTLPYPQGAGSLGTMVWIVSGLGLAFFALGAVIVALDQWLGGQLKVGR